MTRRMWHPCLVCGVECEGPKGGTVCSECRRKVAAYDATRLDISRDHVAVRLRSPYVEGRNNFPHGITVDGCNANQEAGARARLQALLEELHSSFDKPAVRMYSLPKGEARKYEGEPRLTEAEAPRRAYEGQYYNVPESLAQFFVDLPWFINAALLEARAEGKAKGVNLLSQLAAGTLTSAEFETRALDRF